MILKVLLIGQHFISVLLDGFIICVVLLARLLLSVTDRLTFMINTNIPSYIIAFVYQSEDSFAQEICILESLRHNHTKKDNRYHTQLIYGWDLAKEL